VKCKNCSASFEVGSTNAERRGRQVHAKNEKRTAVRLIVATGVAMLVIGGIIALASKSDDRPSPSPRRSVEDRARQRAAYTSMRNARPAPREPAVDMSRVRPHPQALLRAFVAAMADGDEDAMKSAFLFDQYFKQTDLRTRDPLQKYANSDEARQAELRAVVIQEMQSPYLVEVLRQHMVPQLASSESWVWEYDHVDTKGADFRIRCRDGDGRPLLSLRIGLNLRTGMTPEDAVRAEAWGVQSVALKWLQETIAATGDTKRFRSLGIETQKRRETVARKGTKKGPVEADPTRQQVVGGTSEADRTAIQGLIRALIDEGTSGPDYFKAQDKLKDHGKRAVPFLLNELLDREHGDNDTDIMVGHKCCQMLREITGQAFGYAPGKAKFAMQNMASATSEERLTAIRRWFGWWRYNGTRWNGKKAVDEPDEEGK